MEHNLCKESNILNYIFSNKKKCENLYIFDMYSLWHFWFGFTITNSLKKILNTRNIIIVTLIYHSIWELFENSELSIKIFNKLGFIHYNGDSIKNIVGDFISCYIGVFFNIIINNNKYNLFIILYIFLILSILTYKDIL